MSTLVFRITGDPSSFKAAMGDVTKSLDAAGAKAKQVSQSMASLGTSLSVGLTLPVVAAGTAAVRAAADMEKLNKGLASVMGSAEKGAAEFKKLQEAAKLPGLGLEGAVQGSIRLQVLGKTAAESRKIMAELGNAIALVGGGKDDFAEVTRQLGQMLSVGKVTKENLDTITERIPQISKIMIDTWGPQSVGDPAKFFEKAGISSKQFIDIIVEKLGQGARAGDTFANKIGNLEEAVKMASARVGEKMIPALEKLIPKLESMATGIADAIDGFTKLPDTIQNASLAILGLAVASGPILKLVGAFRLLKAEMIAIGAISTGGAIAGAAGGGAAAVKVAASLGLFTGGTAAVGASIPVLAKAGTAAANTATAFTALGAAAASAGAVGVGALVYGLNNSASAAREQKKAVDEAAEGMRRINERFHGTPAATVPAYESLIKFTKGMSAAEVPVKDLTKAIEQASNVIKVRSVQDLIYVESLERVKAAVGKVKDVMYEYSVAGTLVGNKLEIHRSQFDALSVSANSLGTSLHAAGIELDRLGKIPPPQIEITNQGTFRRGSVMEADDILGSSSSRSQAANVAKLEADLARVKQLNMEGKATGNDVITAQQNLKKALEETGKAATKSGKAQSQAIQQVSLVITDLSRGITDVIFKGGKLSGMFKSVASQAAQSITRLLIEGALSKLASKILDVGGLFGKVFGGGTGVIKSAVPGIAGGAASAAGGAASTAASVGGAVASGGVTAIVGAVAGVVGAISSVIGNFQMMGMNKSLDIIVKHTLQTANDLANLRTDQWTRHGQLLTKLDDLWRTNIGIYDLLGRGAGASAVAGGNTFQLVVNGGYYSSDAALGELFDKFTRYIKARR